MDRVELSFVVLALPLGLLMVLGAGPVEGLSFVAAAFLLGMVAWVTVSDLRTLLIPDGPLLAMAILGIASRLSGGIGISGIWGPELTAIGLDVAICGGILLLVREIYFGRTGSDGIGFGDVKLAAASGILVGTSDFAWALLVASLGAIAVVACTSMSGKSIRSAKMPFGAFLAPVVWTAWMLRLWAAV